MAATVRRTMPPPRIVYVDVTNNPNVPMGVRVEFSCGCVTRKWFYVGRYFIITKGPQCSYANHLAGHSTTMAPDLIAIYTGPPCERTNQDFVSFTQEEVHAMVGTSQDYSYAGWVSEERTDFVWPT